MGGLLKELKENGCIYLTISGGEVLSAPYFLEFYKMAYDLNFQIRIVTNLSLLNEKHKSIFLSQKPYVISVSLYGFSDKTYSEFCGVQGMFERVISNIESLCKMGINVELQTVVNTVNYSDITMMNEFANRNKLKIKFYRNMMCEIDGNIRPLEYQISTLQKIESYKLLHDIDSLKESLSINAGVWSYGYKFCFAGLTNCYIDYQGNMFLCNHMQKDKVSLLKSGFKKSWQKMYDLRKKYIEKPNACFSCRNRNICGKCNPVFENMDKSLNFPFPECNQVDELVEKLELEES